MPVDIGRKAVAESWWAFCLRCAALIVFALVLYFVLNWIIACFITMLFRPWQSNPPWDYRDFQKWKLPWELAASTCASMLIIGYLILYSDFGFLREPIQQSEGLTIDSETVAEQVPVDNEDINSPPAPPPSPASSARSTADEWWNADTIIGQEPLPLLATPNIGQEDLRWSTQVLAQLPSYDKDTVFRTEQMTTPTHGKARALHHDQSMTPSPTISLHQRTPLTGTLRDLNR